MTSHPRSSVQGTVPVPTGGLKPPGWWEPVGTVPCAGNRLEPLGTGREPVPGTGSGVYRGNRVGNRLGERQ